MYFDKGVKKAYSSYLREMGLGEASKQISGIKANQRASVATVQLGTTTMKPELSCLVIDAIVSAPGTTLLSKGYSHIIHIVRDRENTPENTVHIPARHSFTLKPVPQWEIRSMEGCAHLSRVLELLKVHRKLLVITDREEVLSMKAPDGCTRETHYRGLSKDKKNRQLCVSKTKQKRQERLETEAVLVLPSSQWQYKDIVQLMNHCDTVRNTFHLYIHPTSSRHCYGSTLECSPSALGSSPAGLTG